MCNTNGHAAKDHYTAKDHFCSYNLIATHNKDTSSSVTSLVLVNVTHMPRQARGTGEFLLTLAAFVITYTSVCCTVPSYGTRSKTPLPTHLTPVRVVASVCGFVEVHGVDSCKRLAAVQTCVVMRCREDIV